MHTAYCLPQTFRCLQVPLYKLSARQLDLPDSLNLTTRSLLIQETNAKPISFNDRKFILRTAAKVLREINPHRFLHLNFLNFDPSKQLLQLKDSLSLRNYTNVQFHEKVRDIFQQMNDFHSVYRRPEPLGSSIAGLGFSISEFYNSTGDEKVPRYVVSDIFPGADFGSFKTGVEILSYDGVPIRQAVKLAGKETSASNPSAQDAAGLDFLTFRFLGTEKIPSANESPKVMFRDLNGSVGNITFQWIYTQFIQEEMEEVQEEMEETSRVIASNSRTEKANVHSPRRPSPSLGLLPQTVRLTENQTIIEVKGNLTNSLQAEILKTSFGEIGRLWIQSFPDFSKEFVEEYTRILKLMPKNGLILDIRSNGGGDPDLVKSILELCSSIESPPFLTNIRASRLNNRLIFEDEDNIVMDDDFRENFDRFITAYKPGMRTASITGERFSGPTTNGLISFRVKERQTQVYHGPIIAVSDARTYSGGDMFASFVVDTGICELVGLANATGGGGASTFSYSIISEMYPKIVKPLPDVGVDFSTSYSRFYRTGNQSGFLVENFGIEPTIRYFPTYRDVIEGDCDLYEFLGQLLTSEK